MKKIWIPLVISTIASPLLIVSHLPAQTDSIVKKTLSSFTVKSEQCRDNCTSIQENNPSPPQISQNLNNKPKIQVAILLDSSNSMDGLIEQARTQIWSVVNAISKVKKNGKAPVFEVSLYHYGNDTLPSSEGFNRMLNELTTDLDGVSESLFSIKTNGGQEYAGWVIDSALQQLKWSNNSSDFRVIFIAGNEPFDQGNHDWEKAVKQAVKEDIIVNTIYCGYSENSESNLWVTAANQGKGSYFNLNQNQQQVSIPTPYDADIAELNKQLNDTYIPYGVRGNELSTRQMQQDSNAFNSSSGSAGINRAITKASSNYRNSSWDLVDALTDNTVDLNSLDKNTLPENLRSSSTNEIRMYVEKMKQKRAKIQAQIAELSQKRAEYIAKNTPKTADNTLDSLMIKTLYQQLAKKGFSIQ